MRIKIQFNQPFIFSTEIAVRVSDINYGGHVGNDRILSMLQDARVAWLRQWELSELNIGGCGLIMADAAVQYKGESFLGDKLNIELLVDSLSGFSFDLFYKISTQRNGEPVNSAFATTAMICFNYDQRAIVSMPAEFREKITLPQNRV